MSGWTIDCLSSFWVMLDIPVRKRYWNCSECTHSDLVTSEQSPFSLSLYPGCQKWIYILGCVTGRATVKEYVLWIWSPKDPRTKKEKSCGCVSSCFGQSLTFSYACLNSLCIFSPVIPCFVTETVSFCCPSLVSIAWRPVLLQPHWWWWGRGWLQRCGRRSWLCCHWNVPCTLSIWR